VTSPEATGSLAELVSTHVGFANPQLGGLETVVVTSAADSGAGSLRAAVSGDEPKHVVFAQDMTIQLSSAVSVGSNTVIDGRGRNILLTAPGESGLVMDHVSNVTIESLTLRDFGDTAQTANNDPYDAIMINASSDVWIDHNDLSVAGDKLVAVQGGSRGVTVSWNRFHEQEQVFQIGAQAGADTDSVQTVTVHHNYFDATGYRNPVISYGRAHVFNNYYRDWRLYAVRSERTAQVYFERNVLAPGRSPKATQTSPSGNGCNDSGTHCDSRPGSLVLVENVSIAGPTLRYEQGGSVFRPADSYAYTAEPANAALAERIAAGAGPLG
jgi:pectate lyase